MVAFPDKASSMRVFDMFADIETDPSHPITLLLLLAIDVAIAGIALGDWRPFKTIGRWRKTALTAIVGFVVFGLWLPFASHGTHTTPAASAAIEVSGWVLLFGCLALICLVITRALTYAEPEVAVPLPTPAGGNAPGS